MVGTLPRVAVQAVAKMLTISAPHNTVAEIEDLRMIKQPFLKSVGQF
jgi:hypothetical protein